ncbi:MAG: hypothetical protein LBG52_05875 [Candidatus Peribacteria bacterium]|nr:hypothetical protein [Candidatus Peribacteria bacterium]
MRMQMDGLSRNILSALRNTDLTQNKVRISFYEKEGFNNSSVRVGNEMIKWHPDYNMIEMNKLIEKEQLRDGTTKTYFDKIDAVFFELLEKDWKFYNPNEDLNNFLPAD